MTEAGNVEFCSEPTRH